MLSNPGFNSTVTGIHTAFHFPASLADQGKRHRDDPLPQFNFVRLLKVEAGTSAVWEKAC